MLKRSLYKIKYICWLICTKWLQWRGYLGEDLEPLVCPYCKCIDFEKCDVYTDDVGEIEYKLKCKNCKSEVGHWSYGSWD